MDTEFMASIISFIETVGAPYVLCFMIYRSSAKRDQLFVKAINSMTRALRNLEARIAGEVLEDED